MYQLTLDEIKEKELMILKKFKIFCDTHDLKFYLAYGTLLGAVRHKGFIPWDDDIDLFMMRDDYNRFINMIRMEHMQVDDHINVKIPGDQDYLFPFIKLIDDSTIVHEQGVSFHHESGLWIDVFPIDTIPTNMKLLNCLIKDVNFCCKKLFWSYSGNDSFFKMIVKKSTTLFSRYVLHRDYTYWIQRIQHDVDQYQNETGIGNMVFRTGMWNVFEHDWFKDTQYLRFEDDIYPVPCGYDEMLKRRYGDYMKIPGEADRQQHRMKAYKK